MYLRKDHHVSRHVPYTKFHKDDDGNPIAILPQAFEMRPEKDKNALSVNWLEYFAGTHKFNIVETIKNFRIHRVSLGGKVGALSAFGIGNVGKLEAVCTSCQYPKVRVIHEEKRESSTNKSHARISRLPVNDQNLMGLLASEVFTEIIRNKDIPE